MRRALLIQLLKDRSQLRPVVLATNLKSGEEKLLYPTESADKNWFMSQAREALRADRSGLAAGSEGEWFFNAFNPPLRLIIVGAVHIAEPLAHIAAISGYGITIVDPRQAFATESRFPGVALSDDWPDEALAGLGPDPRTAVVTLTHDPKLDDPALIAALGTPCFYIGALGSKKTQAARLERLRRAGCDEAALSRIHGPVGLAIGAKSPSEIAIAIMAQMTQVLRA